jgi:hypothetical protein
MLSIFQMHLKVLHSHAGARGVQLAGAVVAPDAGKVHEFDVGGRRGVGRDGAAGARRVGEDVDGRVAHCAFEGVAGVGGAEDCEALCEPGGWGGLCWFEIVRLFFFGLGLGWRGMFFRLMVEIRDGDGDVGGMMREAHRDSG